MGAGEGVPVTPLSGLGGGGESPRPWTLVALPLGLCRRGALEECWHVAGTPPRTLSEWLSLGGMGPLPRSPTIPSLESQSRQGPRVILCLHPGPFLSPPPDPTGLLECCPPLSMHLFWLEHGCHLCASFHPVTSCCSVWGSLSLPGSGVGALQAVGRAGFIGGLRRGSLQPVPVSRWLPAASFLYGTDLSFSLLLQVEQGWGALLSV